MQREGLACGAVQLVEKGHCAHGVAQRGGACDLAQIGSRMILLLLRRELAAGSDEEAEGGAAEIFDGAGKNGSVHRADGIAQTAACGVGKVGADALLGKRLRADIRILPIA